MPDDEADLVNAAVSHYTGQEVHVDRFCLPTGPRKCPSGPLPGINGCSDGDVGVSRSPKRRQGESKGYGT